MSNANRLSLQKKIVIFTDGASKGNPGPGGWGCLIVYPNGKVREFGGGADHVTNNQMELTAVIQGLVHVEHPKSDVVVFTDSSYVINGITKWIFSWKRNHWKTSSGTDVLNRDLWIKLHELSANFSLTWRHVKGHAGIPGNERVDTIADGFARQESIELYDGDLKHYTLDPYSLPDVNKVKKIKSGGKAIYMSYVNGHYFEDADWKSCEARVKGVRGAKFKKAKSFDEILTIKKEWGIDS